MLSYRKDQKGLAHILEIVVIAVVMLTIFSIFKIVKSHSKNSNQNIQPVASKTVSPKKSEPPKTEVNWYMVDGGNWQASGTPPACPAQPIFSTPVDMSLVLVEFD